MSGLFGSTTIKGTRLTDFSGTSAEVGKAIAFGYGAFPVDGFIGWAPLPPVEHRKVKRQGKGGVKQETYTYTLSYAVFFCKGPIYGVKWIKRNGKVVYTTDPNAPLEDTQYAAKWAQRVNFHWGTRDQLPDSLIESYEGVGNVSGFPDMFYITVEDEDVTDNGGAPPNYEACVIANGIAYATTPPYPYIFRDAASTSSPSMGGEIVSLVKESTFVDAATISSMLIGGEIRNPLQEYDFADAAEIEAILTSGEIRSITRTYGFKDAATLSSTLTAGEVKRILVQLSTPKDAVTITSTLTGGTFL